MVRLTPTLVLLPGMDGTGMLFDPLLAVLGDTVKVIRVRYPPDEALGYDALEALARQALPRDEPYVLLGESFSGPIAISLAASRPPGLVGLVLCCSFAATPRPSLRSLRWMVHGALVKWAARVAGGPLLLGRFADARLRALIAQALAPVRATVLERRARAVLDVDVTAQLAAVAVPIHCLQAAQDMLVPPACAELIARTNARVVTHVIDGPHCLLQAAPLPAAEVLRIALDTAGRPGESR